MTIKPTGESLIGIEYPLKTSDGLYWRALLRPQRAACIHRERWGKQCVWLDSYGDDGIPFKTRAQVAQATNKNFIDSWNRMVRNPEL